MFLFFSQKLFSGEISQKRGSHFFTARADITITATFARVEQAESEEGEKRMAAALVTEEFNLRELQKELAAVEVAPVGLA